MPLVLLEAVCLLHCKSLSKTRAGCFSLVRGGEKKASTIDAGVVHGIDFGFLDGR